MGLAKLLYVFPAPFSSGRRLFAFVCLIACLAPTLSKAQDTSDDVLRVSTDLLIFPIRVRNKDKQPIETLSENELTIVDKDKVTSGLYLRRGVDRVALVFALDQSGSAQQIICQQRDAALGLLERFGGESQIAIIRFASTPKVVVDFGRDLSAARAAFRLPAATNQRTALFDAASLAVKSFKKLPLIRFERRIVILITDGLDNTSRSKADEVIKEAIKERVSFYLIHIPLFTPRDGRLVVRPPSRGFRDLAEKTDGKYLLARDARSALAPEQEIDLTPVFKAIEDDLKSQFLLGFYLNETANDGKRHEFSLSLPRDMEFQVWTRGFERKHNFFVNRPKEFLGRPVR